MKCPKCGYLGFETTERCRNCQYDFSLTPFVNEPELTLHAAPKTEAPSDLMLAATAKQTDALSGTSLDLDRLFGDSGPQEPAAVAAAATGAAARETETKAVADDPSSSTVAAVSDEGALPFDDVTIVELIGTNCPATFFRVAEDGGPDAFDPVGER